MKTLVNFCMMIDSSQTFAKDVLIKLIKLHNVHVRCHDNVNEWIGHVSDKGESLLFLSMIEKNLNYDEYFLYDISVTIQNNTILIEDLDDEINAYLRKIDSYEMLSSEQIKEWFGIALKIDAAIEVPKIS